MFGEIKTFESRKRTAAEPLFVQDFSQKENVYIVPGMCPYHLVATLGNLYFKGTVGGLRIYELFPLLKNPFVNQKSNM